MREKLKVRFMTSSPPGLYAKLDDKNGTTQLCPIVVIVMTEDNEWLGILAIDGEMYPASGDEQFVEYVMM